MKKLLAVMAMTALASAAQAATVTYNFNKPLATTEINTTGDLGLFDSTLGTLTGATLTITGAARFIFGATNRGSQEESANLTSTTNIRFDAPLLTALNPFISDSIDLSASSGVQDYAVSQTRNFGPIDGDATRVDNLASLLASLQAPGGGTFGIRCRSLSGLTVLGGGGNLNTTQTTTAGCGAEIVYTYDAVVPPQIPEPGSLALVGLALAGMGAAARRRKA